ncbi:MAG TPA: polymorphic toxin-type HINT domain-containing protein [Gemmataceae bacterium]
MTWVEFLQPGMRFKLEDGGIATVTKVEAPKIVMPPEDKTNEGGAKLKRVLGTIKRTGFVVLDVVAGNQTITTSPGHPFYSVTRRGWVGAGELQVGELLRNFRGRTTPVQSVSQPRYGMIEMYNLEVEDFHTFYVGRSESDGILVYNGIEGLCSIVKPLGEEEAAQLSESVRFRIVRGDAKGRSFGTPRNPRAPTVEEFNPRVGELNAGDIGGAIKGRKHGIFPDQAESISKLSNEEHSASGQTTRLAGSSRGTGSASRASPAERNHPANRSGDATQGHQG